MAKYQADLKTNQTSIEFSIQQHHNMHSSQLHILTISRIDYMLSDKTSLNKCKSTIIIQTMSSKCDEMKLESTQTKTWEIHKYVQIS